MDIMRNNKTRAAGIGTLLSWPLFMVSAPAFSAVEVIPSLTLETHAYRLNLADNDTDRGLAQTLAPGLSLTYDNPWLQSVLNLEQKAVIYRDAQRDNESYTDYRLTNRASFLRDQLSLSLGAGQSYRAAGTTNVSRYVDEITASGNMAKVQTREAGAGYKFEHYNWLNAFVDVKAAKSSTDKSVSVLFDQDPFANFGLDNEVLSASAEVKSRNRAAKFFYGFRANGQKTTREFGEDLYNRRGNGVIGVPFFYRVAMIAQGSFESNSGLDSINPQFANYRSYQSVGGGFEWNISDRSWWNLTYNKINNFQGESEYIGTQFNFQPSRRTKLTGSLDRRFFGRTAELSGSYNLKRLSMAVKVSDSVNSLLALNAADTEFGLFVCPPGVTPGLASCYQPPTAQYQPQPGERYFNIQLPGEDLSDALVVRRSVNYTVGYAFSRLKLQLQLGERRDIYLEQDAEAQDRSASVNANWQLTKRNSLTATSSYSKIEFDGDDGLGNRFGNREGTQASSSVSFKRQINPQLMAGLTARHTEIDYQGRELDYQENRLSFDIKFSF